MEILIIGATGRTGRLIMRLALEEGHHVTAFVRSAEKLNRPLTGVRIVQGDSTDEKEIQNVIFQHKFDAVVVAVGSETFKSSKVRTQTTRNVVDALENRSSSTRLWIVSSAGSNESMDQLDFFSRTFIKNILKGHISDHNKQENLVQKSILPYTIVRPTGLKETGMINDHDYIVITKGPILTNSIRRGDLAHFIVSNIGSQEYIGKAVVVTSKPKNDKPNEL
ncbi:NAD-dependent epimerase/dehydratase family protein [Galbibacter marinus]|uniref:NAD-dependent epimerase/dehydratase family protein n=1 Tax=Galbibacter marinus TaxID=555500 RepID=K2Q103_9FLAO|nr:NAD(P)H-binding protein [Galbibacter marinus]EKF54576.1 NAD-dependent epimerase/dehydratase family protein [Galbibacter marinus]